MDAGALLLSIVALTLAVTNTTPVDSPFRCGPDSVCTCFPFDDGDLRVDCSKKNLQCIPEVPERATILDIGNNTIDISCGNFQPFSNLEELYINDNGIQRLPSKTFLGLVKLKVLNLSGNKLNLTSKVYPSDVFKQLASLQTLFLNGNVDTSGTHTGGFQYPDRSLEHPNNLKTLYIDGLSNTSFGRGFLNMNITTLNLSGFSGSCNVKEINIDTFQNLPSVQLLNLSNRI